LQEREELDDITLRHELEALSTRKTILEHREVNLDWEQKALEDAAPRSWPASSTPIVGKTV
jgi:hypothetical protein